MTSNTTSRPDNASSSTENTGSSSPPTSSSSPGTTITSPTIINLATLPITIILHIFSNLFSFLSRIRMITTEQEEIMEMTPSVQEDLKTSLNKAKNDQELIERDIDDLKKRLERLETRRTMRGKAMAMVDKKID